MHTHKTQRATFCIYSTSLREPCPTCPTAPFPFRQSFLMHPYHFIVCFCVRLTCSVVSITLSFSFRFDFSILCLIGPSSSVTSVPHPLHQQTLIVSMHRHVSEQLSADAPSHIHHRNIPPPFPFVHPQYHHCSCLSVSVPQCYSIWHHIIHITTLFNSFPEQDTIAQNTRWLTQRATQTYNLCRHMAPASRYIARGTAFEKKSQEMGRRIRIGEQPPAFQPPYPPFPPLDG